MAGVRDVAAHYAVRSLFESPSENSRVYSFDAKREAFHLEATPQMRMGVGRARFTSRVTQETAQLSFAAVQTGDRDIEFDVRPSDDGSDPHLLPWRALSRDAWRQVLISTVRVPLGAKAERDGAGRLHDEAVQLQMNLDDPALAVTLQQRIEAAATEFADHPLEIDALDRLRMRLELPTALRVQVVLWEAQNIAYMPLMASHEKWNADAVAGHPDAERWRAVIAAVTRMLGLELVRT
jgi:hypothetical protein